MDLSSLEGVALALLLLVPGGVGDLLMRSVTNMPESRSDFGRVLSAVSWSTAALALCEVLWSGLASSPFGAYMLNAIAEAETLAAVPALALRYLGFVTVAALLPVLTRWLARRVSVAKIFRGRTLLEPGLDRLFSSYCPPPPPSHNWPPYARVYVDDRVAEGFVRWFLSGADEEAGVILQKVGSQTAVWIPGRSVTTIELVDLRYEVKMLDRIINGVATAAE